MDFLYLLRVLLKSKWIIIGAGICAVAVAYYLTRNEPKVFKSTTQISTGFTVSDYVRVGDEINLYDAENKFNNVIVTFTSPSVLSLVSYELMLHDLNNPTKAFRHLNEQQKQTPAFREANLEETRTGLQKKLNDMTMLSSYDPKEKKMLAFMSLYGYDYGALSRSLSVYRYQRSDYLQADFFSENPELSAFVVNQVFQEFLRYYRFMHSTTNKEAIDTLKSIMDKKKQELDVKNAILRQMGGAGGETAAEANYALIADLKKSVQNERATLNQKQIDLQKVNLRLANITGTPVKSSNNEELIAARSAAQKAYSAWLENPGDKNLEDRYKQLNAEYQKKKDAYDAAVNTSPSDGPTESKQSLLNRKSDLELDIQGINRTISGYESQIAILGGTVSAEGVKGATMESMRKEADMANSEYLTAARKYNEASDNSGSSVNNFKQMLIGQPALMPEPSKRKLIVGMAGAVAVISTMLIIILLTYLDSSVKTPGIFSKAVNLKLISMVNFMNLKKRSIEDIVANRADTEDVSEKKRHNVFRESIRKLRYEIESSGKKVFLFTSTKKGQGKTTLIQALSYSMSLSKKKILIIDTNFCNNDLTVMLNAEPVLEKIELESDDKDVMVRQIKNTAKDVGVGSVFVIGSEGGDYTPSEILPRENLLHHLDDLTAEFDYIFLEGPPLNDFSDSKELSQYVDGVIAVFSAKNIIKQIDKESINFFRDLNGKFTGSILNMVDLKNVNVT